ncbi:MAG: Mur ligase family protein [Methanosphaera sp.]|nr:Mur ligase family protein [Methanosphaera sp.]
MNNIKALDLARKIEGKLYGPNINLSGNYTFLNKASKNDIVIRHWINDKGIEIAKEKEIACLITQTPQENAIEVATKLNFPLIVTDNIEYATAFALDNAVCKFASDSFKVAVTGTNGKSTTTHLLFTIFSDLNYVTYTNTDAESEGNTLIDPRVASELKDFYDLNGNIEAICLEVSEVQGWDEKIMKDHSFQMISALGTDVSIITNASADHMNLVESFDDLLYEISGAARALTKFDKESLLVLNNDDENIRMMDRYVKEFENINVMFFGEYSPNVDLPIYYVENEGIYSNGDIYIEYSDLPFTSKHFVQDIMAAITVCEYKKLDRDLVVKSLKNYKPLARRFIRLKNSPVIIDDFAHNPSGIKLTVENGAKLGENLYVIFAIRGSRGEEINHEIAEALVEVLSNFESYNLILTTSTDVVNRLNTVTDSELNIFTNTLEKNGINYILYDKLEDCLVKTISSAEKEDVVLLLGAQGMDPASGLLRKNNII